MGDECRGGFRLRPILSGHRSHSGVETYVYERVLPQEANDACYVFLANKKMGNNSERSRDYCKHIQKEFIGGSAITFSPIMAKLRVNHSA